ncbi:hypothetical protein DV736_g1120, partial [Chaetothyriales sp. CBS 134916]
MSKQSITTLSAKTPSVATLAVPSTAASTSSKSSILKASFAPSRYQLRLFASVIQGFESEQLRIHDTSTGRLHCQHSIKPLVSVTCLDWGQFSPSTTQTYSRKKKSISGEDIVVAYGTSDAEIALFSPAAATVVGSLVGGHERGVSDFKFSQHQRDDAWSLGGDGKLVQWSLKTREPVRSITLPEPAIHTLCPPSHKHEEADILCAFTTPFILTIGAGDDVQVQSFDSMRRPVTVLLRSDHDRANKGGDEHFLSADYGRHIHVYSIEQKSLVRTLLATGEVTEADLYHGESGAWTEKLLSVTTKDGIVELFMRPFVQPTKQNGTLESSRKSLTQKATAKVHLVNSDAKKTRVPIFAASLQGPELHVASVDSGVELTFQKIRWQDEGTGELLFDGVKEVVRTKAASSLNIATANGAKNMSGMQIDESHTVVVNGEANQEPSFGDLLAGRNRGTIDIAAYDANDSRAPTVDNGLLSIPTGLSLGTVLTQALRTNDRALLEACLHTTDHAIIANTIQRLESSLAGILIGKIAERMASRPGRYGDLQVWVQQLCVAHGAALSTLPDAKAKLKTLFKVLDQRAKTLQPLLLLKGKLDMLDAQLRLRRQLAAEHASRQQQAGGVVLVEGDADNWSSDEDIDADGNAKSQQPGRQAKSLAALEDLVSRDSDDEEEEEEEEEGVSLANGIDHHHSSDDEDEDEEYEGVNGLNASTNPRLNRLVDDIADEEEDDSRSDIDDEEDDKGHSLSDDDDDDDEDEEDSEIDSFIDDGPIERDREADDPLLDDAGDTSDDDDNEETQDKSSKRPAMKRSRR